MDHHLETKNIQIFPLTYYYVPCLFKIMKILLSPARPSKGPGIAISVNINFLGILCLGAGIQLPLASHQSMESLVTFNLARVCIVGSH